MKSAVRFRKDSQTEFVKKFSSLCSSKSSWEVWADFIAMSAIAIANAFAVPYLQQKFPELSFDRAQAVYILRQWMASYGNGGNNQ